MNTGKGIPPSMDIVRDWYEKKQNVDEMLEWNPRGLKLWEESVTEAFPPSASILDLGCGLGREAFALSERGFSITGIDISHEVIEQASKLATRRGYEISFLEYDGHTLPFANDSFDVIILWAQTFGLLYGEEYK